MLPLNKLIIIIIIINGFDFVGNQLLITKPNACGGDATSLYFLACYLEKRKQRANANGSCSNFDDIFSGVPQGSTLDSIII